MTTILLLSALLPVAYGMLIGGDFTQMIYKPSYSQINFILTNRRQLIGSSLMLWLAGLLGHFFVQPVSPWLLTVTGLLLGLFTTMGFMMSPYILFKAVRQARWLSPKEADIYLKPEDEIIGVVVNGDSRAFPLDAVLRPHMVKEKIGNLDVTLSYCMLSNSAMAFHSEIAGQKLDFVAPLQWENNLMFFDPASGSLLQQLTGRSVNTPREQTLTALPTQIMSWQAWKTIHPDTQVLHHPARGLFDTAVRYMLRSKIYRPNKEQEPLIFPTIDSIDDRLPRKAEVMGVCVEDDCKAYAVSDLGNRPVHNDLLGGTPLLVTYDKNLDFGDVFKRQVADRILTFWQEVNKDGQVSLVDRETGTHWAMNGKAISGPLEGQQLEPYAHFNKVFWFSWANFFPQTAVNEA